MELRHAPDVGRLVLVVEFFHQPVVELRPDRIEIDVGDHREQGSDQGLQVLEVGLDNVVDQRVLDLHRDVAAVPQPAAVNLADRRRGKSLEIEALEQFVEVVEGTADLELHHLGRHLRRFLLQTAQYLGDLRRQHAVVQTQHLADLHRGALHLAEGLDDTGRVVDQVFGLLDLPRGTGPGDVQNLAADHRRPHPARQPTEFDEAAHGRGDHVVVSQCGPASAAVQLGSSGRWKSAPRPEVEIPLGETLLPWIIRLVSCNIDGQGQGEPSTPGERRPWGGAEPVPPASIRREHTVFSGEFRILHEDSVSTISILTLRYRSEMTAILLTK